MLGNWINARQTREERKVKYHFMRMAKVDHGMAMRMRDWTMNHIILFLYSNKYHADTSQGEWKMKTETQENLVELGSKVVGEIELPQIDISPYVGKKVKIASVKEYEGNFGYYIRAETEDIATLDVKDRDGKPIVIKASRMFSLQEDAQGQIGWGAKTKLGVFLKKKNVKHYRDLVGVEVVATSVTNKNDEKDYLSFN